MEKKKLTDEEIIKALECCTKSGCDDEITGDCPLKNDESCSTILAINALDLIRRLQYGYSSASKASEEWKAKYEKERKENAELQKQVDELTKKNKQLERDKKHIFKELKEVYKELEESIEEEKQTVKDTAKEIYEILETWAWKLKNEKGGLGHFRFAIETAMQEIKQKYSLEVRNFKLVELKKGKGNEKV